MRDITYTLNKEDLKKAGIVFIKKGNLYKKEFVISEVIIGIITGAIAFCITFRRCTNDKIAVFTALAPRTEGLVITQLTNDSFDLIRGVEGASVNFKYITRVLILLL